ncbi:MAG: type IX secretion system membrane protein PorP/SprF [Bacteroidetes bacterium]|nr:MAG: type IX secretion system membrane protein PorP/SprF [Bacteroidota bacterium]
MYSEVKPVSKYYVNTANLKNGMLLTISLYVVILLSAGRKAYGQDALFSQFYANPLYLNPAFAGADRCTRVIFNYRNQPFPTFGTFSTYSFSADTYLERVSGGLGVNLIHDQQAGLLSHTQAGIFYAWQGRLSRDWYINLGMQVSYINFRMNTENLVFPDQHNPFGQGYNLSGESLNDAMSSHNADFSTGVLVYNDRFYAGLAIHHLSQPSIDIFSDENLSSKYSIMMGYDYVPGGRRRTGEERISFSPNIITQSQSGFLRFNYGMYAHLSNLTAGVWFRHNLQHPNSLIFTVGLKQVNYSIGYSYDYSLSGFSTPGGGAHELGVLLNFNCSGTNMKYRILNCPSF